MGRNKVYELNKVLREMEPDPFYKETEISPERNRYYRYHGREAAYRTAFMALVENSLPHREALGFLISEKGFEKMEEFLRCFPAGERDLTLEGFKEAVSEIRCQIS